MQRPRDQRRCPQRPGSAQDYPEQHLCGRPVVCTKRVCAHAGHDRDDRLVGLVALQTALASSSECASGAPRARRMCARITTLCGSSATRLRSPQTPCGSCAINGQGRIAPASASPNAQTCPMAAHAGAAAAGLLGVPLNAVAVRACCGALRVRSCEVNVRALREETWAAGSGAAWLPVGTASWARVLELCSCA